MALKFNAKSITIPFFVVGEEEPDLKVIIEVIVKANTAQRSLDKNER